MPKIRLEKWQPVLYSGGITVRTVAYGKWEYRNVHTKLEHLAK